MTIEENTYALLSAGASVIALVPASRIKPPGNWQNLPLPYIVHFPVAADPLYTHSGRAPLTEWPFYQVSCFGASYSSARAVATAAIATLNGNQAGVNYKWISLRNIPEPISPDAPVIHIALEFAVWEAL